MVSVVYQVICSYQWVFASSKYTKNYILTDQDFAHVYDLMF